MISEINLPRLSRHLGGQYGLEAVFKSAGKLLLVVVGIYFLLGLLTEIINIFADVEAINEFVGVMFQMSLSVLLACSFIGAARAMRVTAVTVEKGLGWWKLEFLAAGTSALFVAITLLSEGFWWLIPPVGFLLGVWIYENYKHFQTYKDDPDQYLTAHLPPAEEEEPYEPQAGTADDAPVSEPKKKALVAPKREDIDSLLAELDRLTGLERVKEEVRDLIATLRVEKQRVEMGMSSEKPTGHVIMLGNPGTGKTTVARLLGRIYHSLGILDKGHVVETDRAGLVGQYQGHTAEKTHAIMNSAVGGVLFVDEAHNLNNSGAGSEDSFGREAVGVLNKRMEDDRERVVVTIAGYPEEITKFLDTDPGLASRFMKTLHFEDYSAEQLLDIIRINLEDNTRSLNYEADAKLGEVISELWKERNPRTWGNAREMRKLYEVIRQAQNRRLGEEKIELSGEALKAQLMEVTREDVERGLDLYRQTKGDNKPPAKDSGLYVAGR